MTTRKAAGLASPLASTFSGLWDDLGLEPAGPDSPRLPARVSHRFAQHVPLGRGPRMRAGPMVSFTFDDVPDSAHTAGADILEEHGARGTFYVAAGLLGTQTYDWRVIDGDGVCDLAARDHEIGCHTFTHLRADKLASAHLGNDLLNNRAALHAIEPSLRLDNFAYPFGYGAFGWKRKLAGLFRTSRAIVPGIQSGRIDTQFLRAVPLMDTRLTMGAIDHLLDSTCKKQGWLIFYSHDVATRPSIHGCRPNLLAYTLRAAAVRGIASLSVRQAMDRIAA